MATIAENLARIQSAKTDIKDAIEAKGVEIPSSATIDTYADYVTSIPSGGGSTADTQALIDLIERDVTSFEIPSGVTSIGDSAFAQCSSLTSVTIPSGVTSIGDSAFTKCYGLTSVTIPSGVTGIYNYAFANCSGLTSITVEAVTPPTLGSNAFNNTNNCPIYVPSDSVDTYKAASDWSNYADRIQDISPNS